MKLRQTAGLAVPLVAASVLLTACSSSSSSSSSGTTSSSPAASSSASAAAGLKTGLKVFVIPKNLGNNYFTTADSANSGGAIAALTALGETGTETSGTAATPASQIPAIQAAISKGANALIVSATDPTALCPTLNAAMKRGITVVTYDSDAPTCRDLFINQASTAQIGTSEVDVLAKQLNQTGDIAIVSATASATNQNAWIGYMKQELKKYPKMKLVSTVYGNDDPTTATQVTQGLLQQYPNLMGIISPTTVGIAAAAAVLDTPKYRGKIALTGLGTPDSLKKYVSDGTIKEFVLWKPNDLGYLAGYAAVELASASSTARRARRSPRASSARTRWARTRPCCSVPRSSSPPPTSASSTSNPHTGSSCVLARDLASTHDPDRRGMERVCFLGRVRPERTIRPRSAAWPGPRSTPGGRTRWRLSSRSRTASRLIRVSGELPRYSTWTDRVRAAQGHNLKWR